MLHDNKELTCFTKGSIEDVLKMYWKDDLFIVQENERVNHNTYILREKVSHVVFNQKDDKTKPI
ncbi:hypothetical protein D3C87_624640 [compost metagenome]